VEDEDSVPDTNTGSDSGAGSGTAPNDAVVNHNDITLDTPAGDEDDNDYEEVGGDVEYDLALVKVVDNTSPVQPGDTITWRIAVRNPGQRVLGCVHGHGHHPHRPHLRHLCRCHLVWCRQRCGDVHHAEPGTRCAGRDHLHHHHRRRERSAVPQLGRDQR
jgi:hypothetical protein